MALKDYYEGAIASTEAAKLTRALLNALRLRSKDDATLHMNNFNLYTDQPLEFQISEQAQQTSSLTNPVGLFVGCLPMQYPAPPKMF